MPSNHKYDRTFVLLLILMFREDAQYATRIEIHPNDGRTKNATEHYVIEPKTSFVCEHMTSCCPWLMMNQGD